MKKSPTIIWTAVVILLASAHAATAQECPGGSVINVSVRGDRLAFATIAEYRRVVDQPSQETREQLARTIAALTGFTSFAQASPDRGASLIPNQYFASILNSNLAVQIGGHIFRVNPSTERVYALPVANEKEYGDLIAENVLNPHIRTFSVDDEVLDEIEAGGEAFRKGLQMGFCKETGIGNKGASTDIVYQTKMKGKATAAFKRYGIYFSLFALANDAGQNPTYTFEFQGGIAANQGQVFYHARCSNKAPTSYTSSENGFQSDHDRKYQSYDGSRNLNKVYFFYRLKATSAFGGGYLTSFVGFRVNK